MNKDRDLQSPKQLKTQEVQNGFHCLRHLLQLGSVTMNLMIA
jgi:hypothetical protein